MPTHLEVVECLDYAAPVVGTVGTSSAELVEANDDRKYLRLENRGVAAIYLAFGASPAVVGSGIYVVATGGVFELTVDNLTNEAVNAISEGADNSVCIQEAN